MNLPFKNKRIIVAPLCWGLGHATRCIPIIQALISENQVSIASDGEALELLKKEFPNLESFEVPGYIIRYKYNSMLANMLTHGPGFLVTLQQETKRAKQIAQSWNADVIISDNRFGFRTDWTYNVYITHQINIPGNIKFVSNLASKIHHKVITKFDECWVPDYKGSKNLAGKLSQVNIPKETTYLGPISRMQKVNLPIEYAYTAVLSGPEPQRTKFEQMLFRIFKKHPETSFCMVRGTDARREIQEDLPNITVFDLATTETLNQVINSSKMIVARSGYTTIMDLVQLEKSAILVPTPGQYEQEYLGQRLDGKHGFEMCPQSEIETMLMKKLK